MSIYRKDQIPPHLADFFEPAESGLEPTPEEYVGRMVEVFRELRRVLRLDGTLWLNMGDSYATQPVGRFNGGGFKDQSAATGGRDLSGIADGSRLNKLKASGLKNKDLLGIPWSLAFALRGDGWWLRQDIIWHKPNPMPESVRDRCTKAHEYVFLLSKSERYFFDSEAMKEPSAGWPVGGAKTRGKTGYASASGAGKSPQRDSYGGLGGDGETRNRRSVWTVATRPYKGAHFATFPPKLIEPCVLAGTSARGVCPACGAPWTRVVSRKRVPTRPGADTKVTGVAMTDGNRDPQRHVTAVETTGWQPGCECDAGPPVPAVVLDPFMGSGTVAEVAVRHGRKAIGCELNPDYLPLIEKRLAAVPPWETAHAPQPTPPAEGRPGDDG